MIYHITTLEEWKRALETGEYRSANLAEEGFIHASLDSQVAGVLERYYRGQSGLVKLTIDPGKLKSQLIHEWSPSTLDTFPHIYGAINLDAVVQAEPVTAG